MHHSFQRALLFAAALFIIPGGQGLSPAPFAVKMFGLSLNTGLNNQLFTLFTIKVFEGKVIQTSPMTREQFVLQVQGAVPSEANPTGENLFQKYGVTACLEYREDSSLIRLQDCWVFDELWKLRFWEYPFRLQQGQHPGKGWAEKREAPSPRQLLLLTEYGMMHVNDVARGENVFHLLRDVADSSWVDNYRKGY